jgi:voltage-gated potassium channel
MAKIAKSRTRRVVRYLKSASRRRAIIETLVRWNRHQLARIIGAMFGLWFLGAVGFYLVERRTNPAFRTLIESFWNVWILLFSGLETPPETAAGRILAMILLTAGVGLAGLFTGTIASILVERQLRRKEVTTFEMDDHIVLCNWSPRGLSWIREVHSKIIQDKRPIVIVHDNPEAIDLPDKQDDPAFNDVYIVKGDTTNEIVLRRARVARAYSVVILADDRQGEYADGKSILTCIAIRNICPPDRQPNIAVECRNPGTRLHLLKSGANEIVSSDELGLRLLARAALFHGMTRVYQELLTVRRDANELYHLPAPPELIGRDFVAIAEMFLRNREERRSCLLLGIQRGEEMILNPIGNEAGPIREGDQLILLSRVVLRVDQALPTNPPIGPAATPSEARTEES